MRFLRLGLKIIGWAFLALVLFGGIATWVVYEYKDRIIQTVVTELNKGLNTKVVVEKIDIAFWETFPKVSIGFHHIKMRGSFLGDDSHLLYADKILLGFNVKDLYKGDYFISETIIENADLHFVIREDGKNNFTVFDQTEEQKDSSNVSFKLNAVKLKNVNILFENRINQQAYDVFCNQGEANFSSTNGSWGMNLGGDFFVHRISVEKHNYLADRQLKLNTELTFNNRTGLYEIKPSDIIIGQSLFVLKGHFGIENGQDIDISLTGKQTTIQTILGLLPTDVKNKLNAYKSEGNVYFVGTIRGKIDSHYAPEAKFSFGCSNASFWHPDYAKKFTNVSFKGLYSNGKKSIGEPSHLKLQNIEGLLDGKHFSSDLEIKDFNNPYIKFDLNGTLDLQGLYKLYKPQNIESFGGEIIVDMYFEGFQKDLQHTTTLDKIKSYGNFQVSNCHFQIKSNQFEVKNLNTQFSYTNTAIHLHELTTLAQGQSILLKGYLYNYLTYLAGSRGDLEGELQLQANTLDLEKLLIDPALANTEKSSKNPSSTPGIHNDAKFTFQCDVKKAIYKKFTSRNLKGKVTLYRKILSADGISMKTAGGTFTLDGKVNLTRPELPVFDGKAKCTNAKVDSLFYLFDNFGQSFITNEHLKGTLNVEADLHVGLNDQYKIRPNSFKALLNVNIKNGELNEFSPMQKLSRFIDSKELYNIRFQELKNTIRIENGIIFIPEMEIKSNVNTVSVLGTQSFEGLMDYKLKVSLKNFKKKDSDAQFGAIREDGANTMLFLTIKGTTDNYKIAYDTQAVKDKIKDSWKKEKEEFKNLFKTNTPINTPKNKPVEVKEDEYIDLDN